MYGTHVVRQMALLTRFGTEVQLFGQHGGEAGDLLLADCTWVSAEVHAALRDLPVHQREQFRELQGAAIPCQHLTQILDIPGAVHSFPVRVVA